MTVSEARLALSLRLAEFLSVGHKPTPDTNLLQLVVGALNDIQPLLAGYEQAVLEEAQFDVMHEVWSEVVDVAEARIHASEADVPDSVAAYQDMRDFALRRRNERRQS